MKKPSQTLTLPEKENVTRRGIVEVFVTLSDASHEDGGSWRFLRVGRFAFPLVSRLQNFSDEASNGGIHAR